jgi:hypothetical protein
MSPDQHDLPLAPENPWLSEGFVYRPDVGAVPAERLLVERIRELPLKEFDFHGETADDPPARAARSGYLAPFYQSSSARSLPMTALRLDGLRRIPSPAPAHIAQISLIPAQGELP